MRWSGIRNTLSATVDLGTALGAVLAANWSIAIISVAIAFGVWLVVTDVENPRTEATFPLDGAVTLRPTFVNVADGFAIEQQAPGVSLRIEAREDDLDSLAPEDFQVRVDMADARAGGIVTRPVEVSTSRDDVTILGVEPPNVSVSLAQVEEKQVEVDVRITGELPDGFQIVGEPEVNPQFVTVTGLPSLVNSVDRAEVRINLSGVRQTPSYTQEARLVPVTATNGNEVARITLSQTTATVVFEIEERSLARTLALDARTEGAPAQGYRIVGIEVEPRSVVATASSSILEGLPNPLPLDPIDISGATADVTAQRQLPSLPGVTLDTQEVTISVRVEAISCGEDDDTPCDWITVPAAPRFTDVPAGLVLAAEPVQASVRLVGPLDQLDEVELTDIDVEVSLAGATAGTNTFAGQVTVLGDGIEDVRALGPVEVTVTLEAVESVP